MYLVFCIRVTSETDESKTVNAEVSAQMLLIHWALIQEKRDWWPIYKLVNPCSSDLAGRLWNELSCSIHCTKDRITTCH